MATSATQKGKIKITLAIIAAVPPVVVAVVQIYQLLRYRKVDMAIAGIVVDQGTNQGIRQATIVVDGRTEGYVTEDSGNFRIDLRTNASKRVRLHVTKPGFQPLDTSVEPPSENLVLQLRKQ